MAGFCRNCGKELADGAKFCPGCGSALQPTGHVDEKVTGGSAASGQAKSSNGMLAGALALLLLAGGGYYLFAGQGAEKLPAVEQKAKQSAQESVRQPAPQKEKTKLERAQDQLKQLGVKGEVLATSYGNGPQGYLSVVKNGSQYNFVTCDQVHNRVGLTAYDEGLYHFREQRTVGNRGRLLFNMNILHDRQDRDAESGSWQGDNHTLVISALYAVENGTVVPGMLNTAKGARPSHYQGYFNEQYNVDIINLFLTEMAALQKNVQENQIILPRA